MMSSVQLGWHLRGYLARAASSGRPRCQGSATRVTQPGQRYQGYAAGAVLPKRRG